jgi:hypothetical protein
MAIAYGVKDPLQGGIVTDSLIFYIHPQIRDSYPGTGTTVTDLVGNQTVTMSGSSMSVTGGRFHFNGSDDKMEVGSSLIDIGGTNTLSSTDSDYTLEAWIYPRTSQGTTTNADCIIGNDTAAGVGMQLGISGSVPRVNYAARSTSNFYSSNLAGYNQWYHVVFSHQQGSFTRTFINGSLDTTASATSFNIAAGTYGNMEIGNATGRVSGYFDGFMGPLRIYKKGLSDAEMLQNFNASREWYGL